MKLIDSEEFVEWLLADAITDEQREFAVKVRYAAERMKPVDAVPVRHGRWEEDVYNEDSFWRCTACGFVSEAHAANLLYKFCPNCGARNIEGDDES